MFFYDKNKAKVLNIYIYIVYNNLVTIFNLKKFGKIEKTNQI